MKGRFLLVDDEPALAAMLARSLRYCGHEVDVALDGESALARWVPDAYDAVFCDIHMPNISGMALLRAIRERDPLQPIVLMTSSPGVFTAIEAVEHGALRYLLKPIDMAELDLTALRAIRARRAAVARENAAQAQAQQAMRMAQAVSTLSMAYQPIVSWSERHVYAYEALARVDGMSPLELFQTAERAGQVHALGRLIRRRVVDSPAPILFVNVHPRELIDDDLYDPAAPLSQAASRVVLEVSGRGTFDEAGGLVERLTALRALGFRIAVDDLGEGCAALATLAKLEPDYLKLDLSLVRHIHEHPVRRHIVRAMTGVCRDIGTQAIAVGVESPAERDVLVSLGCDLQQGHLFARPAAGLPVPSWA